MLTNFCTQRKSAASHLDFRADAHGEVKGSMVFRALPRTSSTQPQVVCEGEEVVFHGRDFARPDAVAPDQPSAWATGPRDAEWHCVVRCAFGSLRCLCGHYVRGPVHLRRTEPATGELGRSLCAAAEAELTREDPGAPEPTEQRP